MKNKKKNKIVELFESSYKVLYGVYWKVCDVLQRDLI